MEITPSLRQIRFTSGLKYNENHTLYRTFDPNGPKFVGTPSTEIDDAWFDIMGSTYACGSDTSNSALKCFAVQDVFITSNEMQKTGENYSFDNETSLYQTE
jgi:hypothetical protein